MIYRLVYQVNRPPGPGYSDSGSSGHPLQPLIERMAGAGSAGGLDPNDLSNVLRGTSPTFVNCTRFHIKT